MHNNKLYLSYRRPLCCNRWKRFIKREGNRATEGKSCGTPPGAEHRRPMIQPPCPKPLTISMAFSYGFGDNATIRRLLMALYIKVLQQRNIVANQWLQYSNLTYRYNWWYKFYTLTGSNLSSNVLNVFWDRSDICMQINCCIKVKFADIWPKFNFNSKLVLD